MRQTIKIIAAVLVLTLAASAQQSANVSKRAIYVSIPDRKLALVVDDVVVKTYSVAVGKDTTPSPTGNFRVINRLEKPTYYHKGQVIPAGPANPIGTRWIGLSEKGYGIHGTNAPNSIGKAASHGCIRMSRKDLEEFFTLVKVGDEVSILTAGDDQIAEYFGHETAAPTVVLAAAQQQSAPVGQ